MAEASATASKAIIVGLSGPSSSGKTTLARLLRDIFPKTFILHQDDFYKIDSQIPFASPGVQDWDCQEAFDLLALKKALLYVRQNGMSPPNLSSKEDKNSVGKVPVSKDLVKDLEWKAGKWHFADIPPIAIIDGLLLYSEGMKEIRELIDVKIFLRTDYKTAKARREARTGYVTLEGFWQDPPGYVDHVVWPNYVKDHAFLFRDGDVEGDLDEEQLRKLKIRAMPDVAQDMDACLLWAYDIVDEELDRFTEPRLPL